MTDTKQEGEWNLHDQLSDRNLACLFLADLDYDSQLDAIVSILDSHEGRAATLSSEIEQIGEDAKRLSGIRNERAVDEWVARLHASVYQGAAHSMAAVGMLAPFVESVFHQGLQGVGDRLTDLGQVPSKPERFADAPEKKRWDCHYVWSDGKATKDVVEGILQLTDATGLSPYLPASLKTMLTALFRYRNKMFHNGFEWPDRQREAFAQAASKWPQEWFTKSTRGDSVWIFYLTDDFIRALLTAIDEVIEGFGKFARAMIEDDHRRNPPIYDYSAFLAARREEDDGRSST